MITPTAPRAAPFIATTAQPNGRLPDALRERAS